MALVGLAFSAVGAAAAWKTLTAKGLGFYSDEESLRRFSPDADDEEARRAEAAINAHPLVAALRRRPELTESRPHMKMPAQYRASSLTGGALMGPRKVPVPAFTWTEAGGKSLVSVVYVGEDLCGHPGRARRDAGDDARRGPRVVLLRRAAAQHWRHGQPQHQLPQAHARGQLPRAARRDDKGRGPQGLGQGPRRAAGRAGPGADHPGRGGCAVHLAKVRVGTPSPSPRPAERTRRKLTGRAADDAQDSLSH